MNFFERKYYQLLVKYLKNKPNADEAYIKANYYLKNNRRLNLENPVDLSEKIQWLKLYQYDESYKKYIDKYEVRKHIKETIGEAYLNELLGVYEDVEEIDIDALPNKFVLKGTHGSGYNIIVEDKATLDWPKAKAQLKKFLSQNYYDKYKEIIYRGIKPRIIAEKFLDQLNDDAILDYKFLCFHGEPKFIHVKALEDGIRKEVDYDINWNKLEIPEERSNYLKRSLDKPDNFEDMIEIAKVLSKDFIFVRVDLYSIEGQIYFGELTFLHKGGMKRVISEPHNKIMGDLIKLPNKK
ncbi:MAG: ATP-grasp fold amidoligase family protein [Bacteroidota bacterium]